MEAKTLEHILSALQDLNAKVEAQQVEVRDLGAEVRGQLQAQGKQLGSLSEQHGMLMEHTIRDQVKDMFGRRSSNPFTCRSVADGVCLVVSRSDSHNHDAVAAHALQVARGLRSIEGLIPAFYAFVERVLDIWLGNSLPAECKWSATVRDSGVFNKPAVDESVWRGGAKDAISAIGRCIGFCNRSAAIAAADPAAAAVSHATAKPATTQPFGFFVPILKKLKFQLQSELDQPVQPMGSVDTHSMDTLTKCDSIGLQLLLYLTAPEEDLLERARSCDSSLRSVRLLEQVELDCRGSCEIHGTCLVVRTGEIKSSRESGFEQLAIASQLRVVLARFIEPTLSTFVVKCDLFRPRARATVGAEGEQPAPALPFNSMAKLDPVTPSYYIHRV